MDKNIMTYWMTWVLTSSLVAQESTNNHLDLNRLMLGKLAYKEGNYQQAHDEIKNILQKTQDQGTYLQYLHSALLTNNTTEALLMTQEILKKNNDIFYQKAEVFLNVYTNKFVNAANLNLLSKENWYEFFSLVPIKERVYFLDKLYVPEMTYSASAKGFMVEIMYYLDLQNDSIELLNKNTEEVNLDLFIAAKKVLKQDQFFNFINEHKNQFNDDTEQSRLAFIAEYFYERKMPNEIINEFKSSKNIDLSVIEELIDGGHHDLVADIFAMKKFEPISKTVIQTRLALVCGDMNLVKKNIENFYPKSSDEYLLLKARYALSQHKNEEALFFLNDVSQSNKLRETILLTLDAYLNLDPKQAIIMLYQIQGKGILNYEEIMLYQGIVLGKLGYKEQAILVLEKLMQESPHYQKGVIALAELYLHDDTLRHKGLALLNAHHDFENTRNVKVLLLGAKFHQSLHNIEESKKLAQKAFEVAIDDAHKSEAKFLINS